jgi:hypothetical protein
LIIQHAFEIAFTVHQFQQISELGSGVALVGNFPPFSRDSNPSFFLPSSWQTILNVMTRKSTFIRIRRSADTGCFLLLN